MSSLTKKLALVALGATLAAPTGLIAQTANPAAPGQTGVRTNIPPRTQPQQRVQAPAAQTAPAPAATGGNWWRTAADKALSRRNEQAQQQQQLQAQQEARGRAEAQASASASRKASRRSARRSVARRAAAAKRELAREQRKLEESGVLRVATGAARSVTQGPGEEVARALGETRTVKSDGRRALAGGKADLAVAPSLDGTLGGDGERVAKLFDAVVLVVARREIATPNELEGQPVEIGEFYSDAEVARGALKTMGLSVRERRSSLKKAIESVATGDTAAAVVVAVKGSTELGEAMAANGDLHVVSVGPNVAAERTTKLTKADVPSLPEGSDVRALPAEISLFAKAGGAVDDESVEAVKGLYGRIPHLLANGAGAWWRSVPLAAEASDAQGWTPTAPDLASEGRGDLAEGLERVGLERAVEVGAAAQEPGRRIWVVGP